MKLRTHAKLNCLKWTDYLYKMDLNRTKLRIFWTDLFELELFD